MTRAIEPRDLCTQRDAASLRGVSVATIRKAIADRKLSIVTVGCHKFLLRKELRRIHSRTVYRSRRPPQPAPISKCIEKCIRPRK